MGVIHKFRGLIVPYKSGVRQAIGDVAGVSILSKVARIDLTTAQILALNTTPVTLLEAPGAGKTLVIKQIIGKIVFNSVAYTGSNALEVRYTNASGVKCTGDLPTTGFLNLASGTAYYVAVGAAGIPVVNAAVVIRVPTADPGAGNSGMSLVIDYDEVTF